MRASEERYRPKYARSITLCNIINVGNETEIGLVIDVQLPQNVRPLPGLGTPETNTLTLLTLGLVTSSDIPRID